METQRLRTIQQPSLVERLLQEFVRTASALPEDAREIRDRSELPSKMQRTIIDASKSGQAWMCLSDGYRTWLFIGEMSMPLSRERGSPVLQVKQYTKDGELADAAAWVADRTARWRRCVE